MEMNLPVHRHLESNDFYAVALDIFFAITLYLLKVLLCTMFRKKIKKIKKKNSTLSHKESQYRRAQRRSLQQSFKDHGMGLAKLIKVTAMCSYFF